MTGKLPTGHSTAGHKGTTTPCVFPVSPEEISLPPRFRALSHNVNEKLYNTLNASQLPSNYQHGHCECFGMGGSSSCIIVVMVTGLYYSVVWCAQSCAVLNTVIGVPKVVHCSALWLVYNHAKKHSTLL